MFSQSEEEKIILDYFKYKQLPNPRFLDIGANDGITYSNVRQLALNGWGGVLLEPSPKAYFRLVQNYNQFENIQTFFFGISDKNEQMEFYDSGDWIDKPGTPPSLLSSLHPDHKDRFYGMNWEKIICNFVKFDFFLDLLGSRCKFDFISIDVEGHEMVVLNQMNLDSLGCSLICLEHADDANRYSQMIEYCSRFGLTVIWKNRDNVILGR